MSLDHKLRLSPFAEWGRPTSTVGYRDVLSRIVVASVALPTDLIERTVLANVAIEIILSGGGEIRSAASGAASGCASATKTVSLDDLVDKLLDRNNIHLEEATESELRMLLERLERSIRAVQRAIAILNSAGTLA